MNESQRIYLDNASTSWPKPQTVYDAVDRYQRELGVPAGRSAYQQAAEAAKLVDSTRRQLADLLNLEHPERIIFTFNGTDSLNLALFGVLRSGDHVVTSAAEHNSVLRPLRHLEDRGVIQVTRVPCDRKGVVDPDEFQRSVRANTRLFALVHASNVTGAVQPIAEVGHIAREHGILYLIDAAQSLGHLPIDLRSLPCDLLASSGHKGILGPLGTGVLYLAPGVDEHVDSFRLGGTGTQSEDDRQPSVLPEKYESGNLNMPGIAGLHAAIQHVGHQGVESIRDHDRLLTQRLLDGLSDVVGVTIHGPADADRQVAVVSISVSGYEPQEVAAVLDGACGIQVRAGLHCAPHMHQALGTAAGGGTVRLSTGPFNVESHIEKAISAIAHLIRAS